MEIAMVPGALECSQESFIINNSRIHKYVIKELWDTKE
jgi:hypothetical protein